MEAKDSSALAATSLLSTPIQSKAVTTSQSVLMLVHSPQSHSTMQGLPTGSAKGQEMLVDKANGCQPEKLKPSKPKHDKTKSKSKEPDHKLSPHSIPLVLVSTTAVSKTTCAVTLVDLAAPGDNPPDMFCKLLNGHLVPGKRHQYSGLRNLFGTHLKKA